MESWAIPAQKSMAILVNLVAEGKETPQECAIQPAFFLC